VRFFVPQRREAFGGVRLEAEGVVYDGGKLGRVRRREHDGGRPVAGVRAVAPHRLEAHGGVRVRDVTDVVVDAPHGPERRLVRDAGAPDAFAQLLLREQPAQALEVARRAHVHRVGEGALGRLELVRAAGEEAREEVVGVMRGDEPAYRQPAAGRQHTGRQVAEVAAGDAEDDLFVAQPVQRPDVIEHLRQQAPHVDRVGRGEQEVRQVGILEGGLHQALAVVEGAVHGQRTHAGTPGDELLLLHGTDLPFGKQQNDLDAGLSREAVGHGAAGVAGGGDQDGERLGLFLHEVRHAPRHDARAEVLEREGGAVEQLQHVHARLSPRPVAGERHERNREVERVGRDRAQRPGRNFVVEPGRQHARSALRKRLGVPCRRERRNGFRHEQPAVGGQSFEQSLLEGSGRRAAAGADERGHGSV